MSGQYILIGHEPKEISDISEWAIWYETADRKVDRTEVDGVGVSTVFLGLNHALLGEEPLLFETMIFGGDEDGYCERYSTWEEAVKGHQFACEKAFAKN